MRRHVSTVNVAACCGLDQAIRTARPGTSLGDYVLTLEGGEEYVDRNDPRNNAFQVTFHEFKFST